MTYEGVAGGFGASEFSARQKAAIIIHGFSLVAAGWSAAWGTIPVAGVTGDTAGLLAICFAMGSALAVVHGRRHRELNLGGFIAMAGQYFAGALLIKWASSLIPFVGTAVNAAISLATFEVMGWALHLIFSDSRDPASLTRRDVREYIKKAEVFRDKVKKEFTWLDNLPPAVDEQYRNYMSEYAQEETTAARRLELEKLIDDLLRPYMPPLGDQNGDKS